MNPQNLRGVSRFRQPDIHARTPRRRLSVGQVDNTNSIPLLDQSCERSAHGDFHIVRMSSHRHNINRSWKFVCHVNPLNSFTLSGFAHQRGQTPYP